MVTNRDAAKSAQSPKQQTRQLGGTRAALFVYAMEGLENMAFVSIAVSLVTYFYGYMNFSLTKSATTLTNMMGTSFLLALFGGFISDTFLTRFHSCLLFGCIELLGYAIVTVQAHLPQLRPIPCNGVVSASKARQCTAAGGGQAALLFAGLYLVALGTGGVKAGLPALGADQFNEKDQAERALLASFFNWFMFSLTAGSIVGVTLVVWIGANQGWDWVLAVCTAAVFFSVVFLSFGRSLFRRNVPNGSAIPRILQVFVAAVRNRDLPIPAKAEELHREIPDKEADEETEILQRTDHLRFLDRAAIIDRSSGNNNPGAWRLCTVTQVEETKIFVRMLPITLSTVFMNTCMAQLQTFSIQQSTTMDTRIWGFRIPSSSLPLIPLLFMFVIIPFYDRAFVPIARRFTGIPTGIRHLQRIGIGLVLSTVSMAVAGIVETRRKAVAFEHGMVDSIEPLPMSVLWMGFQYGIFGAADMFTLVGLLEFFYEESSSGMKSLGTAVSWCSVALGYFLSTVVVEVVNAASGGWLASNNLNWDDLNYFYWLLAGFSVVNFGFYLLCASWYKYKRVGAKLAETASE